jgi:LPPG:FO 2-phospho-L-lactate transferase
MKVVELSGGVGGARMARGFLAVPEVELTVVVNVGDDDETHGLMVSPDLDTVVYTMAGIEGSLGWGRKDDTFIANKEFAVFEMDNTFALGDKDLALKIYRSTRIKAGDRLSEVTRSVTEFLDVDATVLPMTDDQVRTRVGIDNSEWLSFQEYFVHRGHRDIVRALRFEGAEEATPAPGVLEAIQAADMVVIAPSNPPLSIWPILSVPGVQQAVEAHNAVVAVSPLFDGRALKGPAASVMTSLGLPAGNPGIVEAYRGAIDTLIVDSGDAGDAPLIDGVGVVAQDTRIGDLAASTRLARAILGV